MSDPPYLSALLGVELVLAIHEVIIGSAFDAHVMAAFEHQQLAPGVLAGETLVHWTDFKGMHLNEGYSYIGLL